MKPGTTESGPLWRRLAWFVAIWAASVLLLGMVAWILRAVVGS